jgi:hypothetical protein
MDKEQALSDLIHTAESISTLLDRLEFYKLRLKNGEAFSGEDQANMRYLYETTRANLLHAEHLFAENLDS